MKLNKKVKKILIIIFAVLFIAYLVKELPKYRWGYFVKGPDMNYPRRYYYNSIKVNDNEILVLGHKRVPSLKTLSSLTPQERVLYYDTPNEIYNSELNQFNVLDMNFGGDIYYEPEGVLLSENKVLLTNVCKTSKIGKDALIDCYNNYSMAIWDVKTNKYSFIKNPFKRSRMFVEPINQNEVLVLGGWPVIGKYLPDVTYEDRLKEKVKSNDIVVFNLQTGETKKIATLTPENDTIEGVVRVNQNELLIITSARSVYLLNLSSDTCKFLPDVLRTNVSGFVKLSENRFTTQTAYHDKDFGELMLHVLEDNEIVPIEKINVEKVAGRNIVPINDEVIILTNGHKRDMLGNYYPATSVEIIDLKTKRGFSGGVLLCAPVSSDIIKMKGKIVYIGCANKNFIINGPNQMSTMFIINKK